MQRTLRAWGCSVGLCLVVGCGGSTPAPDGTDAPVREVSSPPPAPPATLVFQTPAAATQLVRDQLVGRDWVARTKVVLVASGVERVELLDGASLIQELKAAPWSAEVNLSEDGPHQLVANGYDAAGTKLVSAILELAISPPPASSCQDKLRALGMGFKPVKPQPGVSDPINIDATIEGVIFQSFKAKANAKPAPLMMACEMALRMRELAQLLRKHHVQEVRTMGIYNYRKMRNPDCIAKNDCKLSQHAYATALDIHELRFDTPPPPQANVKSDWIVNKTVRVCPGKPENDADRVLHQVACEMYERRIFNVVLTPNYNERHRDHFHVDLTESWAGIRGEELGVDPAVEGLGD